ncbi:DUF6293 family protein [Thermofilum pendens]|uniref:DUF6293 domain-containing protein n=1 Tax=Thermofilum pendens (strain DSM 2475 / Hrk 5) TaxID=368408 RepID=A1S059_THEPD|nr:hypothetical protein [Thermofilum pendens]ABL78839.1 hypothetical protein Tpen_1442 [Thermofilum pendens Hrk 5]
MVVTVHYVGFHPRLILEGFERVRLRHPVERVYLLYDGKPDKYGAVSRYNVKRLAEVLSFFKPVLVKVNPLSQESIASQVYQVLLHEKRLGASEVLIDVTDMPPLMVAVVSTVALMFPNCRLYAVQPEQIGAFIPDPETPEFADFIRAKDNLTASDLKTVDRPRVSLEVIDDGEGGEEARRVLVTLYVKGSADSITTLIRWVTGLPPDRKPDPTLKASYSRLVSELEERGLVVRRHEGRNRSVELTDLGKAIAEAYLKLGETPSPKLPPLPMPKPATTLDLA